MTEAAGRSPSVRAAPEPALSLSKGGRPGPDTTGAHRGASTDNPPWGVVLLAHGSQRGTSPKECSCAWEATVTPDWCQHCPSTAQGLQEAARRLQAVLGTDRARVVLSCLEFIEPHPDQAMHTMSAQGLRRVVVMPYLLGHGKHATLELDEMLDGVRAQLLGLQIYLAEGLRADPRLADMAVERVRSVGASRRVGTPLHHQDTDHPIGVLLVKAGTKTQYDDCQWLEELGQMVEARLGTGYAVAIAQSHYGDPTMEAATAHLVQARRASSLICVPYLFFPGMILRRNILGGLDRLKRQYPHLSVKVTPPLGVDDRLVAVAADRIREIWAQDEATLPGLAD